MPSSPGNKLLGAVELPATRPYAFGDSPANLDVPQSILNAVARTGGPRPSQEDLVVHRTRSTPRCATAQGVRKAWSPIR